MHLLFQLIDGLLVRESLYRLLSGRLDPLPTIAVHGKV